MKCLLFRGKVFFMEVEGQFCMLLYCSRNTALWKAVLFVTRYHVKRTLLQEFLFFTVTLLRIIICFITFYYCGIYFLLKFRNYKLLVLTVRERKFIFRFVIFAKMVFCEIKSIRAWGAIDGFFKTGEPFS